MLTDPAEHIDPPQEGPNAADARADRFHARLRAYREIVRLEPHSGHQGPEHEPDPDELEQTPAELDGER